MRWFDRPFRFDFPVETYPGILERLHGTPRRLADLCATVPARCLRGRKDEAWSAVEHVGHLGDLEALWTGRIDDFNNGAERLRPADLTNAKTDQANHDERDLDELLDEFRAARGLHVARLEALDPEDFARVALHPRLDQPMRLVDSCFFVAEHDDHHLAILRAMSRS